MKARMRGLDEEYCPHMLDVADLVKQAWEGMSEKTIARCWIKADILPRAVQEELQSVFRNVRGLKRLDDEYEDQLGKLLTVCVVSNYVWPVVLTCPTGYMILVLSWYRIGSVWSHVKMCGTRLLRKFSKRLRALLCLKKEEVVST